MMEGDGTPLGYGDNGKMHEDWGEACGKRFHAKTWPDRMRVRRGGEWARGIAPIPPLLAEFIWICVLCIDRLFLGGTKY